MDILNIKHKYYVLTNINTGKEYEFNCPDTALEYLKKWREEKGDSAKIIISVVLDV